VETEQQTYTFASLKPQTTYEIRVRAYNAEGWGEASLTKLSSPDDSAHISGDVYAVGDGPGTGAIAGIVIIIVLIIIVLVDVACYYVNDCGLLRCICTNFCGKPPPQAKSKEIMMEHGGVKETRIDEPYEEKQMKGEQITIVTERGDADTTSESTPMISAGQNGHHEKRTVSTVV